MLRTRWEKIASKYIMVCHFEFMGDRLPMHSHAPHSRHDVMVESGSVKISGLSWGPEITVSAGQDVVLNDAQAERHEIEALTDNTVTRHVCRESFPMFDQYLSQGWIERPVKENTDARSN